MANTAVFFSSFLVRVSIQVGPFKWRSDGFSTRWMVGTSDGWRHASPWATARTHSLAFWIDTSLSVALSITEGMPLAWYRRLSIAARSASRALLHISVFSTAACFVSLAETHQCALRIGSTEDASRRFFDERRFSISASSLCAAASSPA